MPYNQLCSHLIGPSRRVSSSLQGPLNLMELGDIHNYMKMNICIFGVESYFIHKQGGRQHEDEEELLEKMGAHVSFSSSVDDSGQHTTTRQFLQQIIWLFNLAMCLLIVFASDSSMDIFLLIWTCCNVSLWRFFSMSYLLHSMALIYLSNSHFMERSVAFFSFMNSK